jgi:hypothetical protein
MCPWRYRTAPLCLPKSPLLSRVRQSSLLAPCTSGKRVPSRAVFAACGGRIFLCSAVAVAGFTASCGDRHDELTCEVMLGETRTTASLVTRVGESIDATLNPYVVTFSVLPKSRLRAEVSSAGNARPLMSSETGLRGGAGAMATGEGELTFGCA